MIIDFDPDSITLLIEDLKASIDYWKHHKSRLNRVCRLTALKMLLENKQK